MPDLRVESPEAYLTLALVPGIGCTRLAALLETFGSPERVLRATARELGRVPGIAQVIADNILSMDRAAGKRALAAIEEISGEVLIPEDDRYPGMLRTIPDPPPLLFARGKLDLLARPAVAIVGSRDHSRYGEEVCLALSRAVADAGLVVVSGMARGLDAIAHQGALQVGGGTIGVLGNGFGVIYPVSNRGLYDQVEREGLLVSESPPGEPPTKGSFSRRNRLISGLARVTVVVEAAQVSGTLGTVRYAQDQGREVLTVPGPITSPVSAGTNGLLRDGAGPLLELRDLLDYYPELGFAPTGSGSPAVRRSRAMVDRLLVALRREPLAAEELVERTGVSVEETMEALSVLELRGKVRQEAGVYRAVADSLFG
jgi:DNA processing protein